MENIQEDDQHNKLERFLPKSTLIFGGAAVLLMAMSQPSVAGITVYEDAESGAFAKIGGRIQLQYHYSDPENGESTDSIFFRRLRPYIEGGFAKNWEGKIQFDIGEAEGEDELSVKDAYFGYSGFQGVNLLVGNVDFPFSRELLTSSKKQQLVERTLVGDHNYGTPDPQVGIHLSGELADKDMITWGASIAQAGLDPDADKLDFDTLVNRDADFNEGWMIGGRVDYHPMGKMDFAQGDFTSTPKATIGLGIFTWSNDDDNNTYTDAAGLSTDTDNADIDSVTGFEISGGFRGARISIDLQYNLFTVESVDPAFSGGILVNGETDLENFAVEGGYMVCPQKHFELVAGYELQDADGYADKWSRLSVGANYFFHKHNAKVQLTYRIGENLNGIEGNDENELFLQAQYVF